MPILRLTAPITFVLSSMLCTPFSLAADTEIQATTPTPTAVTATTVEAKASAPKVTFEQITLAAPIQNEQARSLGKRVNQPTIVTLPLSPQSELALQAKNTYASDQAALVKTSAPPQKVTPSATTAPTPPQPKVEVQATPTVDETTEQTDAEHDLAEIGQALAQVQQVAQVVTKHEKATTTPVTAAAPAKSSSAQSQTLSERPVAAASSAQATTAKPQAPASPVAAPSNAASKTISSGSHIVESDSLVPSDQSGVNTTLQPSIVETAPKAPKIIIEQIPTELIDGLLQTLSM